MILSGMVLTSGFTLGLPGGTTPSFSYLLVGGGGSGASAPNLGAGGGGAGGFVTNTMTGVSASNAYTITVGAGGAGVNAGGGNNGISSVINNPVQYSYGFVNTSPANYVATASSSTFNLTGGDWTIEAWYNLNALEASQRFMTFYPASGPIYGVIPAGSGYALCVNLFGSSNVLNGTIYTVAGVWTHVALVSYSGTVTLYVNGVASGTSSNSWCPSTDTQILFGGQPAGQSYAYWYAGYISNIRIVMGTAVYTGAFTPPGLGPLATSGAASAASYPSTTNVNTTFAATATKFLTAQSSTLVDNSLTNYIVGVTTPTNSTNPYSITAIGGGTGGFYPPYTNASSGGSGGGAAWNGADVTHYGAALQPGSASGGLGHAGGNGGYYSGGGGGGAGAVGGTPAIANDGGIGGAGYASSISGSSVTYAGGGGGGASFGAGGAGGSGGGGTGGTYGGAAATAGATNTGSGGGAAAYTGTYGGNGGSGVAIISYSSNYDAASATTGSPTITTSGGYRIYTWTSSGSITF